LLRKLLMNCIWERLKIGIFVMENKLLKDKIQLKMKKKAIKLKLFRILQTINKIHLEIFRRIVQ